MGNGNGAFSFPSLLSALYSCLFSFHLCWSVNITHLNVFTCYVLSTQNNIAERLWKMRYEVAKQRRSMFLSDKLEGTNRKADMGPRQWAHDQYSWDRAALHLNLADQLSASVSSVVSLPAIHFPPFIACHPLTFCSVYRIFIYLTQTVHMKAVCHVLSPPSSPQSLSCHFPPFLSLSISGMLLYNLIDLEQLYETKHAAWGVKHTEYLSTFLGLWAESLTCPSLEVLEKLKEAENL